MTTPEEIRELTDTLRFTGQDGIPDGELVINALNDYAGLLERIAEKRSETALEAGRYNAFAWDRVNKIFAALDDQPEENADD